MNHKTYTFIWRQLIANTNLRAPCSTKNARIDTFRNHSSCRGGATGFGISNNFLMNVNQHPNEKSYSESIQHNETHIQLLRTFPMARSSISTPLIDSNINEMQMISHNHLFSNTVRANPTLTSVRRFKSCHVLSAKGDETDKTPPGIIQKFKKMWKDYWYVVIPVHVVTSVGWYGGFYLLIKSGVDIPAILQWMGTSEAYVEKLSDSNLGIFALMLACYKIATPVRYTVTVGGSTWTVRYLNRKGYMTSNEIKEELTDRSDHLRKLDDKLQHTKIQIIDWKEGIRDEYERAWVKFAKSRKK